jgi:hypothetical protein
MDNNTAAGYVSGRVNPDEDVEGHGFGRGRRLLAAPLSGRIADEVEDVEGHGASSGRIADDVEDVEDVEGHRPIRVGDQDDDVEGHAAKVKI